MSPSGAGGRLVGRILMAAGEWGFGPVVTAEMIIDALGDGVVVDLLARGGAAHYAATAPGLGRCRIIDSVEDAGPCDLVVSVVEPSSLIWARQRGVRAVAIDNLFWHWGWDEHQLREAEAVVEGALDRPADEVLARLRALGGYLDHSPLYLASDRVVWQRVAPPAATLRRVAARTTFVDPLVRPAAPSEKRDLLVVSLSGGLLTPATSTIDRLTYVRLLRTVLSQGIETAREHGWDVEIAAPSGLTEAAAEALGVPARAHDHRSFVELMAGCRALAAPAGLSTTVEAVQAGVGLFTLPELHDGNRANYHGLRCAAHEDEGAFGRVFPASLLGDDGAERSVSELYADYRRLLDAADDPFVRRTRSAFEGFVHRCLRHEAREVLVGAQRSLLLAVAGGLDGIAQVVAVMTDELAAGGRIT